MNDGISIIRIIIIVDEESREEEIIHHKKIHLPLNANFLSIQVADSQLKAVNFQLHIAEVHLRVTDFQLQTTGF